jgi:hypothetical protein
MKIIRNSLNVTPLVALVGVIMTGCNSIPSKLDQVTSDCSSIRQEIIDLTEKDRASRGFALVAIYDPTQVSKTDGELKCTGKASWSDQDNTPINYRQYIDQEGTIMVEYTVPQ